MNFINVTLPTTHVSHTVIQISKPKTRYFLQTKKLTSLWFWNYWDYTWTVGKLTYINKIWKQLNLLQNVLGTFSKFFGDFKFILSRLKNISKIPFKTGLFKNMSTCTYLLFEHQYLRIHLRLLQTLIPFWFLSWHDRKSTLRREHQPLRKKK